MIDAKKIFISYSSTDNACAMLIKEELVKIGFDVWMDSEKIRPGDSIAASITDGLSASDYLIILISENSNKSVWVKREISIAFDLIKTKNLSVIPVLLSNTEVPFEFRGLLYIDARKSFAAGLARLSDFFQAQGSSIAALEADKQHPGMAFDHSLKTATCLARLGAAKLGDLRRQLSQRLSISEIQILWFDVFHKKMEDEVQVVNVALSCVELLDRSRREDSLGELVMAICLNHPGIDKHFT